MWFQQPLWKLPPDWGGQYGLRGFVEKSAEFSYPFYRAFAKDVVLAHFSLFAPQVWLGETVIALSLVFGLFGSAGGLMAFAMGVNLYSANAHVPGEWYWTYVFIALLGGVLSATRLGRYLGVD